MTTIQKTKPAANPVGVSQNIGGRPNLEDRAQAAAVVTQGGVSLTLLMVADGIGGSNAGEEASKLAVDTVWEVITRSPISNPQVLPGLLRHALEVANEQVYQAARKDKAKQGMGTTAVLAAIHDNKLYLANVGDSRAYLVRGQKDVTLHCLTQDHTWEWEMVKEKKLGPAEAAKHPKSGELVRSIGFEPKLEVDLEIHLNGQVSPQGVPLQVNDRLLLCSDGLVKTRHNGPGNYVTDGEIVRQVRQAAPQKAADALVNLAVSRRADDNISAVVWEMPGSQRVLPSLPPMALYAGIGVVGLLLLLVLVLMFRPDPAAGATVAIITPVTAAPGAAQVAPTVTHPPLQEPLTIKVVQSDGVRQLTFQPSETPSVGGEAELMELLLPDGTRLFLAANSGAQIRRVAGQGDAGATVVQLDSGQLVAQAAGPVVVQSPLGAKIELVGGGLIGVTYRQQPFLFAAACLAGTCQLFGDLGGEMALAAGQGAQVGGNGQPTAAEPADYGAYIFAPVVPTPTPTPTVTATATPTETPTPTSSPLPPTHTPTVPPIPPTETTTISPEPTNPPMIPSPPPTDR